jgi:hypothetical protein
MPPNFPEADALSFLLVPHSSQHLAAVVLRESGTPVSVRSVDGWKAGRSLPRVELLDALAVATGVPIREIREAYTRSRVARRALRRARKKPSPPAPKRRSDSRLARAS